MIVALSDTHRETGHGLAGRTASAVNEADHVLHAGDFTTESVLSAFQETAARLHAVHGNSDSPVVIERLPGERVVRLGHVRVALTHHHPGGTNGLALWGQAREADVVIHGHTHRAATEDTGELVLCNPGSHAAPRGGHATHVEFSVTETGLRGVIMTKGGTQLGEFQVSSESS